MLSAHYVVHK